MIRIELLSTENFNPDSLDNYPRKQDVKKVYRKQDLQLKMMKWLDLSG